MRTCSRALRARRRSAGLTQYNLADRSGIAQPTISALECAHRMPRVEEVAALEQAMGYPLGTLLRDVGLVEAVAGPDLSEEDLEAFAYAMAEELARLRAKMRAKSSETGRDTALPDESPDPGNWGLTSDDDTE